MKRVIGVKDLQDSGLLDTKYTESDLYDAFMMYLILNDTQIRGALSCKRVIICLIILFAWGWWLDGLNTFPYRGNDSPC